KTSSSRSTAATRAPSARKAEAIARPSPRAAPITTATSVARCKSTGSLSVPDRGCRGRAPAFSPTITQFRGRGQPPASRCGPWQRSGRRDSALLRWLSCPFDGCGVLLRLAEVALQLALCLEPDLEVGPGG